MDGVVYLLLRRGLPQETPDGLHGGHSLCQKLWGSVFLKLQRSAASA
jgi:hypothetical protein